MRENDWKLEEQAGHVFRLPAAIASRYSRLPVSLVNFLSGLMSCADSSQTSWFLCQSDFEGTSNSAFRWDEWEHLSLEAANGDTKLITEIRAFWNCHFPFLISVNSGYAFHAVCTAEDRFGQIVEGHEPEFEEVSLVADSFENFLSEFINVNRTA